MLFYYEKVIGRGGGGGGGGGQKSANRQREIDDRKLRKETKERNTFTQKNGIHKVNCFLTDEK